MLKEDKDALREAYRARRRAIEAAERAERDRRITQRVLGLISYRYAGTLLLYYPKDDEIDTRALAKAARAAGKRIAYPVTGDGGHMIFRVVDDPEGQMRPGRFGLPEPVPSCPAFDASDAGSALMIVPGLAFDTLGYRLGYGKGYYDRYLEQFPVLSVGLAYREFLTRSLPRGRYDRAVDLIVTERGVKTVAQKERN